MLKINYVICVLLLAVLWLGGGIAMAQSIIPVPLKVKQRNGTFCISKPNYIQI